MSKTIDFFYEISKIPRESGNEQGISNYLCEFAKKRNLNYIRDEYNNVIIKKNNSNKSPIILQAHVDMVCEKDNNIEFDFKKDAIKVVEENGYLTAKGTTLGADNGIGVAQILNILDSDIECNIEAVFTVSEETSMVGAEKIDVSHLEGKQIINLDGFEENTIIIGSACFFDIILKSNYEFRQIESMRSNIYKVSLSGLLGGHSGFDIDKDRGNSSVILAELLNQIEDIELLDFVGGTKFNVIPMTAEAIFSSEFDEKEIKQILNKFIVDKKEKYSNIKILLEKIYNDEKYENEKILVLSNSKNFIKSILEFKHGVFKKNKRNEVVASANLGVVDLKNQVIKIGMRSSSEIEKENCLKYIQEYANNNDLQFIILGSQPGFETSENSFLVKKLKDAYKCVENTEKLSIKSVHITVEVGFFKEKIPGVDVAIISPKILNAHTPDECVDIVSIERCDKWLLKFLQS